VLLRGAEMTSSPIEINLALWVTTVEQVDAVLCPARLPVNDRSRMIFHNEIMCLGYKLSLWDSELPVLNKRSTERHKAEKSYEKHYGHKPRMHLRRRRNEQENYIFYQFYRIFAVINRAPPRNSASLYKFATEAAKLLGFKVSDTKVGFKGAVGFISPHAFRMRIKRLLTEKERRRLNSIAGLTIPAWASRLYEPQLGTAYLPPGTTGLVSTYPDTMFGNLGSLLGGTYRQEVVDQENVEQSWR
jgi:hypothetical protein